MEIRFHPRTIEDFLWFHEYYNERFPAGKENAQMSFDKALALLEEQPKAGHPSEYLRGLRDLSIDRTPFTFIYDFDEERQMLTIMMVYDTRQRQPRFSK